MNVVALLVSEDESKKKIEYGKRTSGKGERDNFLFFKNLYPTLLLYL